MKGGGDNSKLKVIQNTASMPSVNFGLKNHSFLLVYQYNPLNEKINVYISVVSYYELWIINQMSAMYIEYW